MTTENDFIFNDVTVHYAVSRGILHAVEHVSGKICEGNTVGLVGESGCGKSSLARALVGLEKMSAGGAQFHSQILHASTEKEAMRLWRKNVQIVFQDPNSSLNPRLRIHEALREVILAQGNAGLNVEKRIAELLELTGLPREFAQRYPHQLSGGQRQRIGIARALAVGAQFLILDEPVSALDVSVQAQIIQLLKDLQSTQHLSYLFVSHDLGVVDYLCNSVMVMYLGRIVEEGPAHVICRAPQHPYTRALIAAVPSSKSGLRADYHPLPGELPSPLMPPLGCPFSTRCMFATAQCHRELPPLNDSGDGHRVRCFHEF